MHYAGIAIYFIKETRQTAISLADIY